MQEFDERDRALVGHLIALRAVHEATILNIDTMLDLIAGGEAGASELPEAAAAGCPHLNKLDTTPAGSEGRRWFCQDCGATLEVEP